MQFYKQYLMRREGASILPHAGGIRFQQYCVDAYCKTEAMRLRWVRNNQAMLRVEEFATLRDWVSGGPAADVSDSGPGSHAPRVGKPVALSSSFQGGARAMQQNYHDAMAIVRAKGRSHYLITFTANPNWPEIQDNLAPCESVIDRPDLTSRVFKMKFRAFLNDLVKEGVLGAVEGFTWTIEFQKRGLPHARVLLIMRRDHAPRTARDVDIVVSAEIPDKDDPEQKELDHTVTTSMLHGPCGALDPSKPCTDENGCCTKGFPCSFAPETVMQGGKYPIYRRRDNDRAVMKRGVALDNRWVVPYNPFLTKKYSAHINVQVCASIKAVKYLYKYIHKGYDRAAVEVVFQDEVKDFLDARYVGPCGACWRLFSFEMHGRSHAVERLPVHLPGRQAVLWGAEAKRVPEGEPPYVADVTRWYFGGSEDPPYMEAAQQTNLPLEQGRRPHLRLAASRWRSVLPAISSAPHAKRHRLQQGARTCAPRSDLLATRCRTPRPGRLGRGMPRYLGRGVRDTDAEAAARSPRADIDLLRACRSPCAVD